MTTPIRATASAGRAAGIDDVGSGLWGTRSGIASIESIERSPHLTRLVELNLNNTGTSRSGKTAKALEVRLGAGLRF